MSGPIETNNLRNQLREAHWKNDELKARQLISGEKHPHGSIERRIAEMFEMFAMELVVKWNDKVVMNASCSRVMAYENFRLMREQFNGRKVPDAPSLREFMQVVPGAHITWEYSDGISKASVRAGCVAWIGYSPE